MDPPAMKRRIGLHKSEFCEATIVFEAMLNLPVVTKSGLGILIALALAARSTASSPGLPQKTPASSASHRCLMSYLPAIMNGAHIV